MQNWGERIFTTAIGNESKHQVTNQNGVTIAKLASSENLVVKSTMFPHRDIHTPRPFLM
jgi:hypothetical protein